MEKVQTSGMGIRENAQSQGGANGPLQITTLERPIDEYSTNLYLL